MPKDFFKKALETKPGQYFTLKNANIDIHNVALVAMDYTGITNADSIYPVLGTAALETCMGVALYNKKTKTLAVNHGYSHYMDRDFLEMLSKVRGSSNDLVEMHVIGGVKGDDLPMDTLAKAIFSQPNVILKTFDIMRKSHPSAFAIDARNGRLIRGSDNTKKRGLERDYFLDAHCFPDDGFPYDDKNYMYFTAQQHSKSPSKIP